MSVRIFIGSAIAVLALSASASAETIRLKNGRVILADSVRETEKRVEYTIGDNTFAIPRAAVERVDAGGMPVVTQREETQLAVRAPELAGSADIVARVIRDGRVDIEQLAAIDRGASADAAAYANFVAGENERNRGDYDAALRYFDRARTFLPDNDALMSHHGSLLARMNRFADAANIAERAIRIAPQTAYHYGLLGFAQYNLGKMDEAVRSLKKSLELQPDSEIKALLDKVERESKAESAFDEQGSSHFKLRYEGRTVAASLRRQILETLEFHFNDLSRELDFTPREEIYVILYGDQQFFNVTRAPSWTGALNDGKIRLPVSGLTAVTSELSRTLRHELVHSFVAQATRGRAPTWLNEGVAQVMEGATSARDGRRLMQLYAASRAIPLNELEAPFIRFTSAEAQVAYAQSLVSVEYIRNAYGNSAVPSLLKRIGEGQSTEAAMRGVIHAGYADFQREITRWLQHAYPE